jgi:hypothetical protein
LFFSHNLLDFIGFVNYEFKSIKTICFQNKLGGLEELDDLGELGGLDGLDEIDELGELGGLDELDALDEPDSLDDLGVCSRGVSGISTRQLSKLGDNVLYASNRGSKGSLDSG